MYDEAYQEYYTLERESETEREWQEKDERGEDYEERAPSVDDMLDSADWSVWQDKGRSVTDIMYESFTSLTH